MFDMEQQLVILAGLPYSGKTTYLIDLLDGPVALHGAIVQIDAIRIGLHGQRFQPEAEGFVWAIAELMVLSLFAARQPMVLVDATNTTNKRRARWTKLARELEVGCELHVIRTPKAECVRRANAARDAEIVDVIERMAGQWEAPDEEQWQLLSYEQNGQGTKAEVFQLR